MKLIPLQNPNFDIAPRKFKIADDDLKQVGDNIRIPSLESTTNLTRRRLSRFRTTNVPFILATPHHSTVRTRNQGGLGLSGLESYEEIIAEYKEYIVRL